MRETVKKKKKKIDLFAEIVDTDAIMTYENFYSNYNNAEWNAFNQSASKNVFFFLELIFEI